MMKILAVLRFIERRALLTTAFLVAIFGAPLSAGATEYQRVLAIGGAVTEIVYALGEQDRLVGRDSTSRFPPEAIDLPDVGYIRRLSPEGVLSVEPDLILARENNGPPEAVEVLKSAGVKWVDIPDNFTPEGVDENVRLVAEALGVTEKGDELRERIAAQLSAVKQTIDGVSDPKRAMFILSMRNDRVMASGTGTAANGIIELAGAENVLSDFEGYKQLADEAVVTAAPEVIIMMAGRGGSSGHAAANAQLESHPALSLTPAVQNGDIVRMDGLLMLGFGPRTAEAALELASRIYKNELN